MVYINNILSFLNLHNLCIAMLLFPLGSSLIIGFWGKYFKNHIIDIISIFSIAVTLVIASYFLWKFFVSNTQNINTTWYIWGTSGNVQFKLGFLLDKLSVIMLSIVALIALVVNIYSIGYMRTDLNYAKFFSYIAFFTFAMYLLVIANNFLQLLAGWELVGLSSYLLIGFWFTNNAANKAALKAFVINRIGDTGLLLGITAIFYSCNSLDYVTVFKILPQNIQFVDLICMLLFVGIMAKSAQIPLHVWLPDAMEAPTPASALIHAATMVAAGVFLLARLSPIFEYSEYCLNIILLIGALTACLMGILATTENDIKQIIAYSTISQLGVMVAAMGASAYAAGMFHLITHAFFKALLFLGAGSIMLAINKIQNIHNMPQLKKYLPITYWCMLVGVLSMSGFPGFSGFFSKNLILNTVALSNLPFAKKAHYLLLLSVLITAFYSFRLMFTVFHKPENHELENHQESSKIITSPLIFLSILAVISGVLLIYPTLNNKLLGESILVLPTHNVLKEYANHDFTGIIKMLLYGFAENSGVCVVVGIAGAFICYIKKPHLLRILKQVMQNDFLFLYKFFQRQYFFNEINQLIIVSMQFVAKFFTNIIELLLIERLLVNNVTQVVVVFSKVIQKLQTGYLYHYLFFMLTGVLIITSWLLFNIY